MVQLVLRLHLAVFAVAGRLPALSSVMWQKSPQTAGQPLSSQLQRSGVSVACVREAVLHGAVSFRRLRCISAMLDAKLVQIVEWWEEGRLTAAGLQPGEVHHLVRALFEDNDHRRKCLAMIGH